MNHEATSHAHDASRPRRRGAGTTSDSSIRSASTSRSGAISSCSARCPTWSIISTCRASCAGLLIITFMLLKAGLIVAIFMHMAWERLSLIYADPGAAARARHARLADVDRVRLHVLDADPLLRRRRMKQDLWERTKVAAAIGLAVGTVAGSVGFAGWVMAPTIRSSRATPSKACRPSTSPPCSAAGRAAWPSPGTANCCAAISAISRRRGFRSRQGAEPAGPATPLDLGTLLAAADPARGERTAQVCAACHSFGAGEPNRVGPNLHGVVGRPIAAHAGFAYSPALAGAGGRWTYEALDHFLTSPARAFRAPR